MTQLLFRHSLKHNSYDWHCAPQKQFIIYLSSQVKIEASGGESKIFKGGEILLANDLTGKGHISTVIEDGEAIIIKVT